MCKEYWRPVVGLEDKYLVSNYGRIYSLKRNQIRKIRIDSNGYCYFAYRNHLYLIHRLLGIAFLPNPNNLPQINHKDENKANNFVWVNEDGSIDLEKSNLEWCSRTYNMNFGTRTERANSKKCKPILQLSLDGILIREWNSVKEASDCLGKIYGNISGCVNNRWKTAYGYIWKRKQ